jgi:arabinofuranosyltransferase
MNASSNSSISLRLERLFPAIVGAAGIVIALLVWQFRLRFPFDDVFITFRYAEHLASGNGIVWNIGSMTDHAGSHTEGYTNFLFVILLAVARLFTSHLLAVAQVMGLFSTVVTGLALFAIGSKSREPAVGMLSSAFYFLTPLTWINALSGMETSFFVMFISIAVLCAIQNQFFGACGAAFLATLTRPEGALLGMILLVVIVGFQRRSIGHHTLKGTATAFLFGFLMPLIIYAIWKYFYFGEWLPNSFYVKVLSDSHTLLPGLQYVRLFFVSAMVLIVLTCGIHKWRERAVLLMVLWIVALLAFYLFVLPLEGLYDRYLWPAFAMLCITAAIGTHDLAKRLHIRLFIVPAVIVLASHSVLSIFSPRTQQGFAAHEEAWDASMDPIVRELKSLSHFDSLLLAYGDAGYVVYQSGIRHIDLFGLNDTRIAHARTRAERAAIISSERPDIMLLPVYSDGGSSRDSIAWVEDAYGLARTPSFEAVATTEAFPYPLVWLLNVKSPYYFDCKTEIARQIQTKVGYLLPPPSTR